MSTHIVEFPLEAGGKIAVEIQDSEDEIKRTNRAHDTIEQAQHTLESAIDKIRPAAEVIINRLTSLSQPASEIEITFGLKLSAEVGALIASGSAEANYSVRIKWVKKAAGDDETA
jgi:hypothetical protein